MSVEQSIEMLRDDMREVKETLKEVLKSLNSMNERFISNEKDIERVINEYVRINSDFKKENTEIRLQMRDQDDLIWKEIRRCQENCKAVCEKREKECKEVIAISKAEVKKDVKAWLAFAIVSTVGAIVFSIISKIIQGVIK
jgi:L-fucose mutarotase/ribose pyranase (RbsD/FucU family)